MKSNKRGFQATNFSGSARTVQLLPLNSAQSETRRQREIDGLRGKKYVWIEKLSTLLIVACVNLEWCRAIYTSESVFLVKNILEKLSLADSRYLFWRKLCPDQIQLKWELTAATDELWFELPDIDRTAINLPNFTNRISAGTAPWVAASKEG